MRLSINLASRPFINYRPFFVFGGLLAAITLLATLLLAVVGFTTWQERTTTQARLSELAGRRQALLAEQRRLVEELSSPQTQRLLKRAHFLNQLIRHKGVSWTELFFDLQGSLPRQARVLFLSPKVREDGEVVVNLHVGATAAEPLVEFMQSLEKAEKFRDLQLSSQERGVRGGQDNLVAQLSVVYRPE